MLDGDRGYGDRLGQEPRRHDERVARQLEPSLDTKPVALPREGRGRPGRLAHRPGIVRRPAVEAVPDAAELADVAGVRRRQLPAAAVRGRPDRFLEIAGPRRFAGERRTAQELTAGREVDEVEDLAAVARIDADEQLRRAKDDHDRRGDVEPRARMRGFVGMTTSCGGSPLSWSRSASTPAAPTAANGVRIAVNEG